MDKELIIIKMARAIELALEALEESLEYVQEEAENAQRLYGQYPARQARIQGLKDDARKHMDAITAIREALAEQPAQQQDLPDFIAGALGVSRGTAYDLMREALAEQPAQQQFDHTAAANAALRDAQNRSYQIARAAQQQEPVAWMYQCSADSSGPVLMQHKRDWAESGSGLWTETPLYTSPQPSKPLTDEQILRLVPGLQDCLCDPWDYNNSGDDYASIPKDMIRLARAIEAAHGIKGDA